MSRQVTVGVVGVVVKAPAPSSSFTVGQTVTGAPAASADGM